MLVVLVAVILIAIMISNTVNKLCDKIDKLMTVMTDQQTNLKEVLVSNDKDQKMMLDLIHNINYDTKEILKKVVRIDDRTYSCLGGPNKKEVVESEHN